MTEADFVESVLISLGDFSSTMRKRVKKLIPGAVDFIMGKYQWEFTLKSRAFDSVADQDYVEIARSWNFDKEVALRRDDYKGELTYITPREYNRKKAASDTGTGKEGIYYTIMGDPDRRDKRRFYFYPQFGSAIEITMIYSVRIDSGRIDLIPNAHLEVIKGYLIYRVTPPNLVINGVKTSNPSFPTAKFDYQQNLTELIAREQRQRGRTVQAILDNVGKAPYQYFHGR